MLNAKAGFARVVFGKGEDAGLYVVNASLVYDEADKRQPPVEILNIGTAESPVTWQVPITQDAIAAACAEYTYEVESDDGEVFTFKGLHAAALKAYSHSFESTRGAQRLEAVKLYKALRKQGLDRGAAVGRVRDHMAGMEEVIRRDIMSFDSFGGSARSGQKKGVVSESELDGIDDLETLKNLLRSRGGVKL